MHLTTGNLAGDSYKGNLSNYSHLPKHLQHGIKLHRFIDDFTDQSEHITEVAHIFQKNGISKVSFIACDILLDHFLAKNWKDYSDWPYPDFVNSVYAEVSSNLMHTESDFRFLFNKMREYGWFYEYPSIEGIGLILRQFSTRMKFVNQLSQSSDVYLNNQTTIDTYFKTFLTEIKIKSEQFIFDHKLDIS